MTGKVGRPRKRKFSVEGKGKTVDLTVGQDSRPEQQNIYRVDVRTANEAWILCADFDQSDSSFSEMSKGRQCMAISCVALCFLDIKALLLDVDDVHTQVNLNWTADDLNYIIEQGDKLYRISKKKIQTDRSFLNFEQIYPYIDLEDNLYHFNLNYEIDDETDEFRFVRQDKCTVENLTEAILSFSNMSVQRAIFTCENYSTSVFFSHGKLIFFDSYKRRYDGFPVNDYWPEGSAVLCVNKEIIGIVHHHDTTRIQFDGC